MWLPLPEPRSPRTHCPSTVYFQAPATDDLAHERCSITLRPQLFPIRNLHSLREKSVHSPCNSTPPESHLVTVD